jgi:ribonuclease D
MYSSPLSSAQISYALGDVQYLLDMHVKLQRRIDELGRTAWFEEDMQKLTEVRVGSDVQGHRVCSLCGQRVQAAPDVPAMERYRTVRRLAKLKDSPEALFVLRDLAAWREVCYTHLLC